MHCRQLNWWLKEHQWKRKWYIHLPWENSERKLKERIQIKSSHSVSVIKKVLNTSYPFFFLTSHFWQENSAAVGYFSFLPTPAPPPPPPIFGCPRTLGVWYLEESRLCKCYGQSYQFWPSSNVQLTSLWIPSYIGITTTIPVIFFLSVCCFKSHLKRPQIIIIHRDG